jgi:hypothetical protein
LGYAVDRDILKKDNEMEQLEFDFYPRRELTIDEIIEAHPFQIPDNWRDCLVVYQGRPCYKVGTPQAESAILEAGSCVQYVRVCDETYVVDPWRTEWNS